MSKWSAAYRDSRWQKLRLEVMDRDGWVCSSCEKGDGDGVTLNVHHAYYEAGKAPWEYDSDTLTTLCEDCHQKIHEKQKKLLASIMNAGAICGGTEDIIDVLRGFVDAHFKGPAFDNTTAYSEGFALGRMLINPVDAMSITNGQYIQQSGGAK